MKRLPLLTVGVIALLALALPFLASAGTHALQNGGSSCGEGESGENSAWTHEGEPLAGHCEIELAGPMTLDYIGGLGSVSCEMRMTITLDSNATNGTVTSFGPATATCQGKGIFLGCELAGHSANTPWEAAPQTGPSPYIAIEKEGGSAELQFAYSGCAATTSLLKFTTLAPDDHNAISSLSLAGTTTGGGTLTMGPLEVVEGSGTFGIDTE